MNCSRLNCFHQVVKIKIVLLFINLTTFPFSPPHNTLTAIQHKKREGPAMFLPSASLSKTFAQNVGTPENIQINRKFVGNGPGIPILLIVNMEFYGTMLPLGSNSFKTTTPP